jgi:short subunit dehydrogenase-like uncharacterized protein
VIAVYGATGYTGRLVARELARRGLEARLCGRNGGKLRALKQELGVDWQCRAAPVDDSPALRKALDGASVVISCAGPFTYYGAPVIEAALDVGAHYCDTTGEQPYMKRVFDFLDEPARERGVAVVPAVGFDIVPGDLAAALACGDGTWDEVVVAYAVTGFGMSRGTMRSAAEMLTGEDLEYADGDWQAARGGLIRERFAFPEPLGEQDVTKFPGGEVVTVPRHVSTRAVRGRMTLGTYAPHPSLAGAVPFAVPVVGALMQTPLGGALDGLIDRLPEGPDDEAREASRFTIVAEARAGDGSTSRVSVAGSDVYGLTAVIAVEVARQMGERGFDAKGALAPAQVVDPEGFLSFLADHGVTYEAESPRGRTKTRA